MKAVIQRAYGPPSVLQLADVAAPVVGTGEVLVRVLAAGVNAGDWDLLHGTPYVLRPLTGLVRPKNAILGFAVAGCIEALGSGVSSVGVGDGIYAEVARGGFAEYAVVPVTALSRKPSNLTFQQAAAVPVAGVAALQAMRDVARVQPGQAVLVNGAAGGVGTFAVQIAKTLGAKVTGVASAANADLLRAIGADHIVDHTRDDFTRSGSKYDVLLDNVGNRTLSDLRRALRPNGILIPNSNKGPGRWLGGYLRRALCALAMSPFVSQRLRPFASTGSQADLNTLRDMIEQGTVRPIIDRTYPLDALADALTHYGAGHTRGRIVITMQSPGAESCRM